MEQAWRYYDTVGQLRFVANWVANVMSRARLKVAVEVDGMLVPVDEGPAADALAQYFGGLEGQAMMLQRTGLNLTVTGEAYHVVDPDDESWHVLASGRVTQSQGKVYADFGDGRKKELKKGTFATRVWVEHPRDPMQADSPVRSNLGTLEEIVRLNEHVAAQLDSRLTGAGILFLPSEIQFPQADGDDPSASTADRFLSALGEAMMTALQNRASPAAKVPLVVTAPGDALDKVKHLTFWSELDAAVLEMRDSAVKHLALGLDTPPEVLLGVGDSNHWNAWLVDDSAVKSHLEPRLAVVAAAATVSYLRPALEGQVPDPSLWHVVADTSALRVRPDRSPQAIDLYDRGELSGEALRRETGFGEFDAPSDAEAVVWLLRKVATGSTSPEQTVEALKRLGVDLGLVMSEGNSPIPALERNRGRQTQERAPGISRAERRAERIANGEMPDGGPLAAASEVLVMRALERAGNRLVGGRARSYQINQIPVHERYLMASGQNDALLEGTWGFAEGILAEYTDRPAAVVSALDMYVRGLLTAQVKHTREGLLAALANVGA
jgi:hypothetical protein